MNNPSPAFQPPAIEQMAGWFPEYEIKGLVACRGMGAVYWAVKPALSRVVVIKLLASEFLENAAFFTQLVADARALEGVSHPNLIQVFEHGEVGGMPFIVMEFVRGESLAEVMQRAPMGVAGAIRVVSEVAAGLSAAHQLGVLHRHLYPANILFDDKGSAKVGDFGLVRPITTQNGSRKIAYGAPGYAAPEVLVPPHGYDHRSDIFSLGVLLHELLTGKLPEQDPRPPSSICGCDPRLDKVVRKAMHANPDIRYQDAAMMAQELGKLAVAINPPPASASSQVPLVTPKTLAAMRATHAVRASRVTPATQPVKPPGVATASQVLTASHAVAPSQPLATAPPTAPVPVPLVSVKNDRGRLFLWGAVAAVGLVLLFLLRGCFFGSDDTGGQVTVVLESDAEASADAPVRDDRQDSPASGRDESPRARERALAPENRPSGTQAADASSADVEMPEADIGAFLKRFRSQIPDDCRLDRRLKENAMSFRSEIHRVSRQELDEQWWEAVDNNIASEMERIEQRGYRMVDQMESNLRYKPWAQKILAEFKRQEAEIESSEPQADYHINKLQVLVPMLREAGRPEDAGAIEAEIEKLRNQPDYFRSLMGLAPQSTPAGVQPPAAAPQPPASAPRVESAQTPSVVSRPPATKPATPPAAAKFDVDGFFQHARKVMTERCQPVMEKQRGSYEANIKDYEGAMEKTWQYNNKEDQWPEIQKEFEIERAQIRNNGNRMSAQLPASLKARYWAAKQHKIFTEKEAAIDQATMGLLREQAKTYLTGLEFRLAKLREDNDPAAAQLIEAEIARVRADPDYFPRMMLAAFSDR